MIFCWHKWGTQTANITQQHVASCCNKVLSTNQQTVTLKTCKKCGKQNSWYTIDVPQLKGHRFKMKPEDALRSIKWREAVNKLATTIINPDHIDEWLKQPLPGFDNRTGEDILNSKEYDKIDQLIYWIGSGAVS